jgi:hypothetical protein
VNILVPFIVELCNSFRCEAEFIAFSGVKHKSESDRCRTRPLEKRNGPGHPR